ncbi:MAG: phosphodiester glycosidase family protein [Anaerolineales bacterium]|jgi:hypothetical protein|nr:phosphodiester glycosidase family protein [Anaerolineales bacterium]
MKRYWWILILVVFLGLGAFIFIYYASRPAMVEMREELYPGITYYRRVHYAPRTMVAHIVTVDLRVQGLDVFVTPPDRRGRNQESPLDARTTSQFARDFGVQIAINGDGFTPWWANTPWDYYPKIGQPVKPHGLSASRRIQYGDFVRNGPTIFINDKKEASFGAPIRKIYNAISGMSWLVRDKQPIEDLNDTRTAPRTAIGLDGPGNRLILIVVDGRQPFYSEGVTVQEMADLMIFYGGDNAINLDGGGSSTLVIQNPKTGKYEVMNSPINFIWGRERPVANHLGIFASP